MTPTKKRRLLPVSLVIVIAVAAAVYFVWNKPHKNVRDATAVMVAATDLYSLFITDSSKAAILYVDKVVQVTGRVEKIAVNQQSQNVVLIKTGATGAYINCTMEEKPAGIKEQDIVSIKGICSGYISGDADMGLPGDVFLTRGYLFK